MTSSLCRLEHSSRGGHLGQAEDGRPAQQLAGAHGLEPLAALTGRAELEGNPPLDDQVEPRLLLAFAEGERAGWCSRIPAIEASGAR